MPRPITNGLLLFTLALAACSPVLQVEPAGHYDPHAAAIGVEQPDRFWWQLRFKLTWPEDEGPDFSHHALIAEQLMVPVIDEYQADMPLWRFHRRARRTPSGHQFSLIFYSDQATATQVHDAVESDPLTTWLHANGLIEKVRFDRHSPGELSRLELASDPQWPAAIQRSWPYYIMGASQAWLVLVQEISAQSKLEGRVDYPALLEHYRMVDEQLTAQWRETGQHAYLHHLNAVFGYQPLQIESTILTSF
jgi:hypothetical protein